MPRLPGAEPVEAVLTALADALDQVDVGILMLDRDMRVLFMNHCFIALWAVPSGLQDGAPSFRDLLDHIETAFWDPLPAEDRRAYLDGREEAVRRGSIAPTQIDFPDGRRLRFRCDACQDGRRILTYADISEELRHGAEEALAKIRADMRFNNETLQRQATDLVALAEAAEASAQRAELARQLLEHEIEERAQLELQLRQIATTDGLTNALNRAAFLAAGQREVERVRRQERNFAVLMVDADHFKVVNDRYGHAGGDLALQHLVKTCRAVTREIDLVGRLGGEEFAVALPGISPAAALEVAERLRQGIAGTPLAFGETRISLTISIGLAMLDGADLTIERLLARADAALYRAKESGRNRVVLAQAA